MPVPDRNTFESAYAGQPRWEIGRPQKAFLDVADRITGSVLDVGCGTGENALFFAVLGRKVTGIDFLQEPIQWANAQSDRAGAVGQLLRHGRSGPESPPRTLRQRDRQRVVSRLLGRGPPPLRRGAGDGVEAGRSALPAQLQRRGAGDARGRGGWRRRNCTPPSPRAGAWSPSCRPVTTFDPISRP